MNLKQKLCQNTQKKNYFNRKKYVINVSSKGIQLKAQVNLKQTIFQNLQQQQKYIENTYIKKIWKDMV